MNAEIEYRKDVLIEYDGNSYDGVAVLPVKDEYEFKFTANGDLDWLSISTCHRDEITEEAWNVVKRRIFGLKILNKKQVNYVYSPTEIEKDCDLEIKAYNKSGYHSFGHISFFNSDYTLDALVECNGHSKAYSGASACQTKVGLIQKVNFANLVITSPEEDCPLEENEGEYFEIKAQSGMCKYVFMEKSTRRLHVLTVYGYEKAPVRE